MAKTWEIGTTTVKVDGGQVELTYKGYPPVVTIVPEMTQWLLVRKPVLTIVGAGQVWLRFKNEVRNASLLIKFQTSSDFKSLDVFGGRYYTHYDKNQVLVRTSQDF